MLEARGTRCWTFAGARFDERSYELRVSGEAVHLSQAALEVLHRLLARAGDVITFDELADVVGTAPGDSSLERSIARLRLALRDHDASMIRSVAGQGYRLDAPVRVANTQPTVHLSPQFKRASGEIRRGAALIVDIAGTVRLRSELGDAAAGRLIVHLLDSVISAAGRHHGEFIKSYGDDVLAIFERDPVNSAAKVAIEAQRLASKAGLQLYAGLHCGEVEFLETMGHPDALGLTVNFAARLHKLTEGAPGRIFLTEESVLALKPDLRARASRYGVRELKGIGATTVWTLEWHDDGMTQETVYAQPGADSAPTCLRLRHGADSAQLAADAGSSFLGRGKECVLRVPDPIPRISSTHLQVECRSGRWFVQDISRNGTWLRDGKTGEESQLPYCTQTMLPRSGAFCLGRGFGEDGEGHYTVQFEVASE